MNQSVPGIRISVQQAQKLVASYQQIAASSTLFIPVTTITASQRYRSGQTSDTWITSVKRETLSQEGCRYTHELVTVSITEAPYVPKCETWHIVSEKTEVENIPEDYKPLIQKHKLRNISVAIAARLPQSRKEKSGDQYRLYSKLPLPTLTSLPVHLDGSFILADDRRSIRFDEGGQLNDESRYNTWILEAKIPPLYHFLLETWPQPSRAIDLWPGTHKSRDFLTRTVIDAFYIALVGSPSKFCVSMTGLQCRPSDSVFVGNDVHVIGRIAKDLGEQELIQVPEAVWGRMRDLNLRKLDSPYILDLLKRKACTLKLAFTEKKIMIRDINHLLQFLLNDPTISESLVGLPLLPLADGSIVSLGRSSAATHYLVVPPAAGSASSWKPWPFLPAQAFVDPALSTTLLLKHKFNVSSFAGPHVVNLIATVFPRGNMRCLSHHEQRWVSSFWEQFHSLNISMADLDGFPFIPTIEQGTHVSIRHCQSDSVLGYTRYQSADVDWLPQVLVKLGAYVVNTSKCPATLQSCLPPLNIDFKSIVKFLATKVSSTLPGLFKQLSDTDQIKFAEYARNGVRYLRVETVVGGGNNRQTIFTVEHQNTARELPIWKAQKGTTSMLLAASDSRLKMLPLSVSVSTVNHFRVESTDFFVNYNVDLSGVLNVEPLSIDDLVNNFLQLPSVLSNSQVPHFYQLLSSVISTKQLPFFLPNTNLTMVNCNTLFAHSERLFRLAFRNKPELFLYPTLRDLESQLEAFGFHISVDFAAFQKCAQVVDQTRDEQSATEVYQWYSNNLWMLTRNNAVQWHQLDDLRFIPRSEIRRSYREPAFSPLGFARQLPQIVSPKEVLRTEFEPVAWTQRALFREVPSQQLLLANPSLGVPSPIHVVCISSFLCNSLY